MTALKRPAYQWYVADARGDEIYMLMTYEQRGIYRELLDHQWVNGSLPADPVDIGRLLAGFSRTKFLRLWPLISTKFLQKTDGRWINAKLEKQRETLDQFIEERRKRGQIGGRRKADNLAAASLQLEDKPLQKPSSSSSSSSSTENKEPEQERTPTRTPDRSVTRTSAPLISQSAHRNHAICGVVCIPAAMYEDFCKRARHRPNPQAYVSEFFATWDTRYHSGDRATEEIGGDAFDFWRKRWDETHPTTAAKSAFDPVEFARKRIEANDARYGKR